MKTGYERPPKFWRPQDVWILQCKCNTGFATPANSTGVCESQSVAGSLISEISINTGGQYMAKKGGMKNAPSKSFGRKSGKGRSNR